MLSSDDPTCLPQGLQDSLALDTLQGTHRGGGDWTRWLQFVYLNVKNPFSRQDHGPFDEVLQFSDVSRPRMATKRRHRLLRNRLNPLVHALRIIFHVMAYQKRNVFRPLPQRRNPQGENVE